MLKDFYLRFFRKKISLNILSNTLHDCHKEKVIDSDSLAMIEGVLNVAKMKVRDIMIPRSQMIVINCDQSIEEIAKTIIDSKHSRFPVICENKDDIIGILLAKDLLNYFHSSQNKFEIKEFVREVFFVPESKKLDNLLRDFQIKHSHMALVLDEYGNIAGLVTIEDVIEMIVGDIEDEGFIDTELQCVTKLDNGSYSVLGTTTIEELNEELNMKIDNSNFDTIGGFIAAKIGHIPKPGKVVRFNNCEFTIVKSNAKQILRLEILKI